MSLGQRLQKAPEKSSSSEQTAQDYEATIRRLKLLSKSQTALLKVNLHTHFICHLFSSNPTFIVY
jgi:hypothetical protein